MDQKKASRDLTNVAVAGLDDERLSKIKILQRNAIKDTDIIVKKR